MTDASEMIERVARAISGAPFPSKASYAKARAAITAMGDWRTMDTAPKDGTLFLVWAAPGQHGLPEMFSLCSWHPDAGFCICELREPTHWMPLPAPPRASPD